MLNNGNQLTQSTLYEQFKEYYQKMKESEKPSVVFALHELDCQNAKGLYQVTLKLIESGIDFAISKQIDKRIWAVIISQIETQSKIQSIGPDLDKEIREFYNTKINFIKQIIETINEKNTNLGQIVKDNEHRSFLANFYCYNGELYEQMAKHMMKCGKDGIDSFKMSDAYFNKALLIYPYCGKFHFLIGTVMIHFSDTFAATCALLKAIMSQQNFNCKENLNEVFEKNRQHYNEWAKHLKPGSELERDIHLKAFMIYLIRLTSIIFTKIGFEELPNLQKMFPFLQEYFKIIRTNVHSDHQNQYKLLCKVILITNFGLHFMCNMGEKQLKTCEDIKENDLLRESIKFVYGIYINILDFILKYLIQNSQKNLDQVPPQTFLQLVIPIIYYLYDQPLISTYLLSQYPLLNDKLAQIYWFSRQSLNKSETNDNVDIFELQNTLNEQFHNYLFPFEMPILGYTCYNHVLNHFKKQHIIQNNNDESDTLIVLFYVCEQIIQQLHGMQIGTASQLPIEWEEDVKKQIEKKLIIVDGMNVAMRFGEEQKGETRFRSLGLKITLEYWLKKGHECLIILPDFCFNEKEIEKKREQNKNINKIPDDVKMLIDIKNKGYAHGVPNWNYDDSFMIQHARDKGGYILTNDRYNDHIKSLDSNIIERERLKEWIRNNCISYTFLQNDLVPNPDFFKKM